MVADGNRELNKDIPGVARLVFDREGGRVGMLVASVEHGLALRRIFDWPLLAKDVTGTK